MKYKQKKNKIRKIYDKIKSNKVKLTNLDNTVKNYFLRGDKITPAVTLKETEWENFDPSTNYNRVTDKGTLIPEQVLYEKYLDFYLPENLIPFVDVAVLVKTHDTKEKPVAISPEWEMSRWEEDYVEVYTDGTIIYKGIGLPDGITTQEYIDDGTVKHYKDNWRTAYDEDGNQTWIYFTKYGTQYRIKGDVVTVTVTTNPAPQPTELYRCFMHGTYEGNEGNEYGNKLQIYSMNSTTINMRALREYTVYELTGYDEDDDPIYDYVTHYQDGVTYNGTYGNNYEIVLNGVMQRKVGDTWQSYSSGFVYVDTDIDTDIILPDFEKNNYWVFYDTNLRYKIEMYDTGEDEGDSDKWNCYLPPAEEVSISTVTIKRNPDPYPVKKILSTSIESGYGGSNRKRFFRVSPETEEDRTKYRLIMDGKILKTVKAKKIYQEYEYVEYNDTYTNVYPSIPNWTENKNHTFKERVLYTSESIPISLKFIVKIKNPLEYHEIQKYSAQN